MSRDQIFQVLISFAVEPRNEVIRLLNSAVKQLIQTQGYAMCPGP